jgi:hypothetical protein
MNYRCSDKPLGCSLHPKAKLWIQGKNPRKQRLAFDLAAGVFSETWDYTGRASARPENFSNFSMAKKRRQQPSVSSESVAVVEAQLSAIGASL